MIEILASAKCICSPDCLIFASGDSLRRLHKNLAALNIDLERLTYLRTDLRVGDWF